MDAANAAIDALQREVNRYHLVSRLADDLAHEIKNPLHAMVINTELVKRRVSTGDAESALERVEVVDQEIGRVHEITDRLLWLIRPARESAPPTDVGELLDGLVPLLELQGKVNRIELDYEGAPAGADVPIRSEALEQALLNLVGNAVDAIGSDGGRIAIEAASSDGEVRVRVSDTGPGLAAELDELAAPGRTSRSGRAGLGLAVTRDIVADAGGRLESGGPDDEPRGATFILVLPQAFDG